MNLTIVEESPFRPAEYAQVPIGFTVTEVFDDAAISTLLSGTPATPSALARPYWKDYDRHRDSHPTDWPKRFDLSHWTSFAAYDDSRRVGGAVLILGDPDVDLLRGHTDCGLLWDLRVGPDVRGQGIGSALLDAVVRKAARSGAPEIWVETQQVNVPACRLYQRHGFRLERAIKGAYAELPSEVELLWRKSL